MSDGPDVSDEGEKFDPEATDRREIGREMVDESTGLGSVMAHTYRGEMDQATTWRSRLDQTTTWAVMVLAAVLTWAFSSPDNPHYILLIGLGMLAAFAGIETRRYRDYDVYRSRIRIVQQNLIANALDPSEGVVHSDWRRKLSEDYRRPTLKVPWGEALANRLRHVYLPLFGVTLAAWVSRITVFTPNQSWLDSAAIVVIPGWVVVGLVALFTLGVLVVTFWPRERRAKGEFRDGEFGEWKDDDQT